MRLKISFQLWNYNLEKNNCEYLFLKVWFLIIILNLTKVFVSSYILHGLIKLSSAKKHITQLNILIKKKNPL